MSQIETRVQGSSMVSVEQGVRSVIDRLAWIANFVAPLVLRVALAVPFFRSGLTKWDGFLSLSPSATFLFEEEFKLNIFGAEYDFPAPIVMAHLTALAEITLPVLLVLGLATRFAALGLLVMTSVIQLVVPDGWANFHLPWASMAIGIIALGAGSMSLDHLIDRFFADRKPLGAP